jgi:hypothetical protein
LIKSHRFDQKYHARVTIFSKCIVAVDSLCLALMLRQSSLMDKEWWNKIWCNELGLSSVPDEQTLLMMRNGFSQFYAVFCHRELTSAQQIEGQSLGFIATNQSNGTANKTEGATAAL